MNEQISKEKDIHQILAVLISCLAILNTGITFAWSSPAIPAIIEDKINYNISLEEASYFTVIPSLTSAAVSLIFSKLMDHIGRKHTLIFVAIPQLAAWILISQAKSIWMFYVSRVLTGIADGCIFIVLPPYVGEVSTPKVRGTWGNCLTFNLYFGQFLCNTLGKFLSVKNSAYVCSILPIIFGISFYFMPESPYYLIMKNRDQDAIEAIRKLKGKHDVDLDFQNLSKDVKRQMSESGTWKDLFGISSNKKALISGVFLRISQQLAGVSVFLVYTQYIFQKSGSTLDSRTSTIIFTALTVVFSFIAAFTLDKVGRKRSYMISMFSSGVLLLIEAIYFCIEKNRVDISLNEFKWIPLAGMLSYVVTYSLGIGIAPTLMLGELFSASIKGKGLCFLNIVFGLSLAGVTKLFQLMETNFGLYSPFLLFAINCFLSTLLAFYLVPETKGKTLEEIQQEMKGNRKTKTTKALLNSNTLNIK